MQIKKQLLQVLNVHDNEWWIVSRLFVLQFFQGAAIAIFYTASGALFLEQNEIHQLPYVYIISAVLLWLVGAFYSYWEEKIPFNRFHSRLLLFVSGSIILWGLLVVFNIYNLTFFLLFAWYNVLYVTNNLHFWGIAAHVFDVRQSKRVFGVISAGDIPSKLLGYLGASLLATIIEPEYIIVISAVFILISLVTWRIIARSGIIQHHEPSHSHTEHHKRKTLSDTFKFLVKNHYVVNLAILSFIVYSSIIIISYAFYAEVKERYHGDAALATFLGAFMAGGRVLALLLKLLFTSRIINALGIRSALLISPFVLLLCALSVIVSRLQSGDQLSFLMLFGTMAILADVLRTSIQTPVFISMMQPMPTHDRMRAHNVVKGIMDPFAFLFSGFTLISINRFAGGDTLFWATVLISVLLIFWIAWIITVHRMYLALLVKSLSSRFFAESDMDLYDEETFKTFEKKLATTETSESLAIIRMLYSMGAPNLPAIINEQLKSKEPTIVAECIKIAWLENMQQLQPELLRIATASEDHSLKGFALKAYCAIDPDLNVLNGFLKNTDIRIQRISATGILKMGESEYRMAAEDLINGWLNSTDPYERLQAVKSLRNFKDEKSCESIIRLMHDENERVAVTAIKAAGLMESEEVLDEALTFIRTREHAVIYALVESKEISLPLIRHALLSDRFGTRITKRLIVITGMIHIPQTNDLLVTLLHEQRQYKRELIDALYQNEFHAEKTEIAEFEKLCISYLHAGAEIIYMIHYLKTTTNYPMLKKALENELNELRLTLLKIFSFIYERGKVTRIMRGFETATKESQANSLELVELVARKNIADLFNVIFENTPVETKVPKVKSLHTHVNMDINHMLKIILHEKGFEYNVWTKSIILFEAKNNNHKFETNLLTSTTQIDHVMLKETTEYAIM